ncbi:phospholipid-transporting ATPase 1 [Lentinula edodes]|uniref:phospholipid-transporting ATPase 1 n=1 Tax=Lentinula edodes TaxID=5353 RepID=UPI001E8DDFCF|nr:phospholipid-transporting ATPase 1 [Lentinula edodes]KAH7868232.1 phospholipid-transporting ATPase 1 [Lentinula edodes]KAJ3917146.1 phospholipid-transporting ATPase 1 [Lentinula edodes]
MSFLKRPSTARHSDSDEEEDDNIDPELRLRTVRTAASALEESIRTEEKAQRRKTRRRRRLFGSRSEKKRSHEPPTGVDSGAPSTEIPGVRRNVYVNHPLGHSELDQDGEPIARYERNKVRTTKYTIITFLPKNLFEQFRRVANLFFLVLDVAQLFPVFGAAAGAISVLPLVFILVVTALKDAIEDYSRARLDDQVNNSAVTRIGGSWRNVNLAKDPRSWFDKLRGVPPPGQVTKGVRKLREREASEAGAVMRTALIRSNTSQTAFTDYPSSFDIPNQGAGGRKLEDIQSVDSHSYPPAGEPMSNRSFSESSTRIGLGSMSNYAQSHYSRSSIGVVDYRKHVAGAATWERTLWKKLEVGDIVLLRDNEQVPADVVVLATSDPDGMCYLETKNLDGETNLKPRRSVKATMGITSEEDIERSSFYLDSEPPHQNLYLYHGVLRYKDTITGERKQEPVTINELLLRGCTIRNTAWTVALVVFTGADTKIMLNGGETPSKRSKIERETNFNVMVTFVLLLAMCIFAAILNGLQDAKTGTSAEFFEIDVDATDSHILNALVTFVSCLIAFQNLVPISLYISIEIVKTIQAYFISQDVDMYYKPYDTPCVPKTWNISDDLGQIEYIFSDKTGTLTQNIMEFQKCSINGVIYGEGVTEAQRGAATRDGNTADMLNPEELNEKLASLKQQMISVMERSFKNRYLQPEKLTLVAPKLAQDLTDRQGSSPQRAHIIAFFRALAVCHTVLSDKPDPERDPFHLEYKAESPDEAALVAAARDVGFPFINKGKDGIDIEVMGQKERYEVLKVLEFNSTRKRMSVVVRNPEGKLVLYTKGADSVIYARLASDHNAMVKDQTSKDMEVFANGGLRTLCIAYRELEEDEYLGWARRYDAAVNAVEGRDEEIDKANEEIERGLRILGATALEDKLQEGVPEAIETLHRAGIKLWILTGDKLQTAIEIGYSCNLLKQQMDVMIISADSPQDARAQIEAGLNKIASVLGPPSWDIRKRGFVPGARASFAVVIDGDTLRYALAPELKELFLNLGTQCETVVCCRVSPAQKALTVKLVKEGRKAMTLSIGDGANDVAMIQEANIGCGLFGLEGSQAAMSADYAFGQFRFLTKLLLVHGRWSYQRVADMHANFFYKNVIWTFAMFWFLPFNNFDATYLYQYTFILLYNLVFTSLPVIVMGAFDQDLNAKAALAFPQLYVRGIRGLEYTRTKFWLYMGDGLYQSIVVFFIPYLVWTLGIAVSWNGKTIESLSDFGTTASVAAILAANSYVGINTNYWTVITWIVIFGSTISMMLWITVYSFFFSSDFINEVIILFGELTFWTTVIFSAAVALAPRFIIKFINSAYFPLDKDIIRESWVRGDLKDQLGIGHRKGNRQKDISVSALEAAPMFHDAHNRSASEISQNPYEPTLTSSPGTGGVPLRHTYLDTPPLTDIIEETTMASPVQYAYATSDDLMPPSTILPDGPSRASYYSASDLPPPSPLPSPKYKYSDGTITSTPPSRRSSVATMRTVPPQTPPANVPLPPPPLQQRSPNTTLMLPGAMGDLTRRLSGGGGGGSYQPPLSPQSYEMRIRSPPLGSPGTSEFSHAQRSASAASYATANDDYFTAEGEAVVSMPHHHPQHQMFNSYGPGQGQTLSPYYNQQYPVQTPGVEEDFDAQTVRQSQYSQYSQYDDRRASAISGVSEFSWQGGRAM